MVVFCLNDTATAEIYTLSLHDALPICEILGVVGGSGTGKSVLMRSIIGLQTPDAGEVRVFGEETIGRDEDEAKDIRRRWGIDRKSTRLNSSHANISYAVFCLKKKNSRN